MINPANEESLADDEDPRIQRVYRRMRILVGITALIMGLGFAVVFSVIIYRLVNTEAPAPGPAGEAALRTLALPEGARVVATAADGGRLYVTVDAAGRTFVHVLDGRTLAELARLEIAPGGAAAPPLH